MRSIDDFAWEVSKVVADMYEKAGPMVSSVAAVSAGMAVKDGVHFAEEFTSIDDEFPPVDVEVITTDVNGRHRIAKFGSSKAFYNYDSGGFGEYVPNVVSWRLMNHF